MDEKRMEDIFARDVELAFEAWAQTITIDLSTWIAKRLIHIGYRLDPYPNGKSKDELIAIIESKETNLLNARNLMRDEHDRSIRGDYFGLTRDTEKHISHIREWHSQRTPQCQICQFINGFNRVKA
jgi:hypothetical protein